jgi:hypothetical protein
VSRLFRPFTSKPDGKSVRARQRRRRELHKAKVAAIALREKIKANQPLTDADHRVLAKMGPRTLRAVGYTPKVTLT